MRRLVGWWCSFGIYWRKKSRKRESGGSSEGRGDHFWLFWKKGWFCTFVLDEMKISSTTSTLLLNAAKRQQQKKLDGLLNTKRTAFNHIFFI
jgi:hypothetical protein